MKHIAQYFYACQLESSISGQELGLCKINLDIIDVSFLLLFKQLREIVNVTRKAEQIYKYEINYENLPPMKIQVILYSLTFHSEDVKQ
jgi:hypothetical protein